MLICLATTIASALAADLYISNSNIEFGEVEWGYSVTKSFNIRNNGTVEKSVTLSSTHNSNYYTVSFNTGSFVLMPNEDKKVDVTVLLKKDKPENEGGNKNIGNIEVKANNSLAGSISMNLTALPRLRISNLDVKVASSTDSDVEDGDTITKKAKPGDEVVFSVELENMFHRDDSKYDIEETNIQVTIQEIDDGDDIDDDSDDFIIDAGEKKTTDFTLKIPEIVQAGNYKVVIKAEGRNSENRSNKYSIEWSLKLDVEKKKHDVTISKSELNPAILFCGISKTTLNLGLFNIGDSDESNVAIDVKNSNLNINERFTGISMGKDFDSDARYQKDIPLEIADEFIVPGIYPLTISVYFDSDKLDDQKSVNLEIRGCNQEEVPQENTSAVVEPAIQEEVLINNEDNSEQIIEEKQEQESITTPVPSVTLKNFDDSKASSYFSYTIGVLALAGIVVMSMLLINLTKRN